MFREEMGKTCEDHFLKTCADNDLVRDTLATYVAFKGIKKAAGKAQKDVVTNLSHSLQAIIRSNSTHTVSQKVAHTSNLVAANLSATFGPRTAHAVGRAVSTAFKHQIALCLEYTMLHILQSHAVQTIITHNVSNPVTAAVVQTAVHHLGISKVSLALHHMVYSVLGAILL
jgi:hypothetical protein